MPEHLSSLGVLLANLPEVLSTVQIIVYVGLIFFFGSIAVMGFRTYTHWYIRLLIRIALGFLALISGIALSPFIPFFTGPIYEMLQLDLIVSGIIASIILGISLYLISFSSFNIPGIEKKISSLKNKLEDAKSKEPTNITKGIQIGGIVLLAAFLILSIVNFRGFPSISERISSLLPEQFRDILSGFEDLSNECGETAAILARHQDELTDLNLYENEFLKQEIESKTGSSVSQMVSTVLENKTIVIAITESGKNCYATETELCICASLQ